MSGIRREAEKVRRRQRAAMDEQAALGSTREGVLEAGLRAALDHALEGLAADLPRLRGALGVSIDGGAFLLGSQVMVLVMHGVNSIDVVERYGPLLREYMERAREL